MELQIIRCKNCEHYRKWDSGETTCIYWTDQWDMSTEPDGFCSFGKLKLGYEVETYESVTHGHWNCELADNGWKDHICSECGYTENTDIHVRLDYKYCPNCGAKMDK